MQAHKSDKKPLHKIPLAGYKVVNNVSEYYFEALSDIANALGNSNHWLPFNICIVIHILHFLCLQVKTYCMNNTNFALLFEPRNISYKAVVYVTYRIQNIPHSRRPVDLLLLYPRMDEYEIWEEIFLKK